MKIVKQSRLGEILVNTRGTPMKIIEFKNQANIIVEFQDEYKYKIPSTYCNFKRGTISNPYDKTIYGVGYIGIGKYITHIGDDHTKAYDTWKNMILRCYYEKERDKHPAYAGCTVAEIWHNYQNFAKWYEENYYEISTGRMHIDKDILINGNKEYAPDKCVFVPQRINMIFMKKSRDIEDDLPTGIHRVVNGYSAQYNGKSLGVFPSLEEAVDNYMIQKRKHIKKVANEYRNEIPPYIYEALLRW